MTFADLIPAVQEAVTGYVNDARADLQARGKNASGTIGRTLRTRVVGGGNPVELQFVSGTVEALDYWKYVGNGRGPGAMPPVDNIRAWIDTRGLDLSPWAVAKKIAKEGSSDHRKGNVNVFEETHGKWERSNDIVELQRKAAVIGGDVAARAIINNLKAA